MSKILPSTNDQYDIAAYILRKFGANDADDDHLDLVLEYVDIEGIAEALDQETSDD